LTVQAVENSAVNPHSSCRNPWKASKIGKINEVVPFLRLEWTHFYKGLL